MLKKLILYAFKGMAIGAAIYLFILMLSFGKVETDTQDIVGVFIMGGLIGLLTDIFNWDYIPFYTALIIHFVISFAIVTTVNILLDKHFLNSHIMFQYISLFIITYTIVWVGNYISIKMSVEEMNKCLQKKNN